MLRHILVQSFFLLVIMYMTDSYADGSDVRYWKFGSHVQGAYMGAMDMRIGTTGIIHWVSPQVNWYWNGTHALDPDGDPIPSDTIRDALTDAFTEWNSVSSSTINFIRQSATSDSCSFIDNKNVLFWSKNGSTLGGYGIYNNSVRGVTLVTNKSTAYNEYYDIDVCFNSLYVKWTTNPNEVSLANSVADIQSVAAHEIGHMAGLGHNADGDSTIMKTYPWDTSFRQLGDQDIFGVSFLYGGRLISDIVLSEYSYFFDWSVSIDGNETVLIPDNVTNTRTYFYFPESKGLVINGTLMINDIMTIQHSGSGNKFSGIDIRSGGCIEISDSALSGDILIEDAVQGLKISNSNGLINNGSNKITIKNCTDCSILVDNASPTIRKVECDNTDTHGSNTAIGIRVNGGSANPEILYTTLKESDNGIKIESSGGDAQADYCDFQNNIESASILLNSGTSILLNSPGLGGNNNIDPAAGLKAIDNNTTSSIAAQNNWWGQTLGIGELFTDSTRIDYSSHLSSAVGSAGAGKPSLSIVYSKPFEAAQISEKAGNYAEAVTQYREAFETETNTRWKKFILTCMIRTIDKYNGDYSIPREIIFRELPSATGWYEAMLDYLLIDITVREGKYAEAAGEFAEKSGKYRGTWMESEMLARAAKLYGDYCGMNDTALEYANRAAMVNPGSYSVRLAYSAAGIDYDNTLYEDRFAGKNETFGIAPDSDQDKTVEKTAPSISISPNPANPSTTIHFTIVQPGNVSLSVYSVSGQKVATLADGFMPAGTHAAMFDGSSFASGLYLYRFEATGFAKTGKIVLVK